MKFPVVPFAPFSNVACLLLLMGNLRAEPAATSRSIPVVVEKVYQPTDLAGLRKRLGRRVVIEGKIVAMGRSRSGGTSYLNFTKNYRDSVSLVFLGTKGANGISEEQIVALVGRTIHIGGLIEERSGALQVRVLAMEQIRELR